MKKNSFFTFCMILLSSLSVGLSSCDKDNDLEDDLQAEGPMLTLETPLLEDEARVYKISSQTSGAGYSQIELTETGHYIINNGSIFGKYTTYGRTYTLENLGEMSATMKDANLYRIVIQPTGKASITLVGYTSDTKEKENSQMTINLCRNWKFESATVKLENKGKVELDYTSNKTTDIQEQLKLLGFITHETTNVKEISFTKTGRSFIEYEDGKLALDAWNYATENDNTHQYISILSPVLDRPLSHKLSFNKKQQLVMSSESTYNDKEIKCTYVFTEIKE